MTGGCRGTVYACPIGVLLLKYGGEELAKEYGTSSFREDGTMQIAAPLWDRRVLIVEGGPAFLRFASEMNQKTGSASAVFGVFSGAWPDSSVGDGLASRLKGASMVAIARDHGKSGEHLAEQIHATCKRIGLKSRIVAPNLGKSKGRT